MLLLFFACQNIYSPDKISGPWTVSDFQFEEDTLGLETAIQGLSSFQYTFGTDDYSYDTGLEWTSYDDGFDSYSEEDANDLWTFCYTNAPYPTFSCDVAPIVLYQDQWLPSIEERLGISEECTQQSSFRAMIASENEIWARGTITIDCNMSYNYSYDYRTDYSAHWTR
tara:strand:- start:63 stop:566 length:504 start_codon:yes stop_codon:yes gene_type:complete